MINFKPNDHFFFYLYFIMERMNIFWKRVESGEEPFTDDSVLSVNKFTNAYRVLDRSSQYLLKNVIYNEKGMANDYDSEDIFWRILLYKHFNLPSTWDYLEKELGEITLSTPDSDISDALKKYKENNVVYSPAYLSTTAFMKSEKSRVKYGLLDGMPKFELYLRVFRQDFIKDGIMYGILSSPSFEKAFNEIKRVVGVADFLGYQLIQDLNYSTLVYYDDNEFCAAGEGTIRGIKRVFDIEGKPDYGQIVKWTCSNYDQLVEDYSKKFNVDLRAKFLNNWGMKVPDFSNCFCETDKYMRMKGVKVKGVEGSHMRSKFRPNGDKIDYFFPPKWGEVSVKTH